MDNEVNRHDSVQAENVVRGVADTVVDQQPVVRSRRNRKPSSKYDPAVYDLDSVQLRGIPLSGKKNGWRGVYWPRNLVSFYIYFRSLFGIEKQYNG